MLKKVPNVVLGLSKSSTYPVRGKSCPGSSGRVGENWYASGAFVGCGLAGQRFDQPSG